MKKLLEEKPSRIGDAGVEVKPMQNDIGDSAEGLVEDNKSLADVDKRREVKVHEEPSRKRIGCSG